MKGILELEVFVGQFQFIQQKKQQTVDEHAWLKVFSVKDWSEHVYIIDELYPLENQHLEDITRTQGRLMRRNRQVLPFCPLHTII